MSLFANNEVIKLYIKDKQIVDEETDEWVAVPKELSAALREEAMRIFQNSKIEVTREGNAILDMAAINTIPFNFLAQVIKDWSEPVPVTIENLKKVEASVLIAIWKTLQATYHISGENVI